MPSTQNKTENDKISHYRLNELLVEQAVSAVYLAQDEKTEDLVLLVTLQPDATRSNDLADRFRRRAETVAQLEHDAILPLLDFGVDGKRPYAVMAYLPGQFLAERLQDSAKPDPEDKAKIIESLQLVKQLAGGLAVSHPAGLIHHDLRPENIYLDDAGKPYLLDLVVPPSSPATTQLEAKPATELDYQSPEQLTGKALSGRSNIYSLGILLYRLLAGQQPELPGSEWDIFEHKGSVREIPLNQVQPGLTAATYKAVQDSIWQKEWSRFETIDTQMRAIDQAITEESAPPPPPPPIWLKLFNQLRQPRTLKIVIPAIVLLFLLLLVLMFMRGRANRQSNATPTPDAAVLPVASETAVNIQPEDDQTTPTVTATATNEETVGEVEVLPSAEEVESPTVRPSPTETAVSATEPAPTATTSPTSEATSTSPPTATPTFEPTETACIPSPPFGWVRYTIQANDSLSALSEATNITVEQLMQVNCLDNILLSIGQVIWMPALEATATGTAETTSTSTSPTAVPPAPNPPGPNPTSPPPTPTPPAPPSPSP